MKHPNTPKSIKKVIYLMFSDGTSVAQ